MPSDSQNNKRIAQNTLLLYFRMLFLMLVSLYTSRVNLNALGIEDFGIYNVVGGLVAMFSIISGSLVSSISRFITFELGTENKEKLKKVFSTAVSIQFFLVIIVVILAETIGLWFLNNKMVIPEERILAANIIYQFSIISFALSLMSIPYTGTIVAHEKMSAFAYISIFDVIGKLAVALTISIAPIDKLIWFAGFIVFNSTIIQSIYIFYCKRHFEECTYHFIFDKSLLKNMFGFAGWNFIGSIAAILRDQGGNIVINMFCGPAVNAARGVAMQVNNAVSGFVSNFETALNPQITKSYASGNYDYMMQLIFQGARLSYYILLILALPIISNTHFILQLWLGQVPKHTVLFVQLVLFFTMSESLANPLINAMLATGKIKKFQIIVGGLNLVNLPLSYICLRLGCIPESVVIIAIIISMICEMARVIMLRNMIHFPARSFLKKVYFNVIFVTITASILPLYLHFILEENIYTFTLISVVSFSCTLLSILYIGCSSEERVMVFSKVKVIVNKVSKRYK
ncbi:MAG: lipopolysaccharide biosynthesis protein [Bacteroides fragilis]|nr:lipopolysaccharide biosynthesis protein [Bacteroides fragilis]